MKEWQSLSHVKWECKYHIVIVPKYRKKVLYGRLRKRVGQILRELCQQKGVELVEGHARPDHVHLCLSIPPLDTAWPSSWAFSKARARFGFTESGRKTGQWLGSTFGRGGTA